MTFADLKKLVAEAERLGVHGLTPVCAASEHRRDAGGFDTTEISRGVVNFHGSTKVLLVCDKAYHFVAG